MRVKHKLILSAVSVLLLMLLAGCGSNSTSPGNSDAVQPNLTDVFGGYKATDEAPAFGDPTLQSMDGGEAANDDMGHPQTLDSLSHLPGLNVYSVRILWGHLDYDSSETQTTDWTGSLTLLHGAIVSYRLIGFEEGDHIVRPRTSARELSFVSHTKPYYDGILFYIFDPANSDSAGGNTLTFATAPFSKTFTIDELDSVDEIDNAGNNEVSFNAYKVTNIACENGYLDGRWVKKGNEDGAGEFMGRWISKDGLIFGHFKGHFGTRNDSTKVFFGKWIGANGQFHAFIKGAWSYADDVDPLLLNKGLFIGKMYGRDSTEIGSLSGDWVTGLNMHGVHEGMGHERGHSFLRGEWAANCAN